MRDVKGHLTIRVRSTTVLPVKYFAFGLRFEPEMYERETKINVSFPNWNGERGRVVSSQFYHRTGT